MDDLQAAYRILDANANRASEGLRTIEEIARMVLESEPLSRDLKSLRHDLQQFVGRLDQNCLLQARDTAGDIGTGIAVTQENSREGLLEIAQSAAGRVQQALRCLEEFSKVVAPEIAPHFESIRYRSYDLTASALLALSHRASPRFTTDARLYLLYDCERSLEEFESQLRELCQAGVDIVQLRDKNADDRKLFEYGQLARTITRETKRFFIINDRIDLAMALEADGVHLGQEDLPIGMARKVIGDRMWVGVSTHTIEQAIRAEQEGADYIGCGPTFESQTKVFDRFAGIDFLKQVAHRISIPAFAIGGIKESNLRQVLETGVVRVAVQNSLLHANDRKGVANSMAKILSEGPSFSD